MFFLFICKLHLKWTKILSNFTAWACIKTTCFHHPELVPCKVIRIPECEKFLLVECEIQESKFHWKGIQNPRPSWITWRRRKSTRSERTNCHFCSALFCLKGNKGQDRHKRIYLDHMTASLVNESHASYNHANSVTMRSIKFIGTIAIRVTLESRSNISSLLLAKLRDRTFINFRGKKIRKPFTYQT